MVPVPGYLVFDAGVPRLDLLTGPLDNRAPTHTKILSMVRIAVLSLSERR